MLHFFSLTCSSVSATFRSWLLPPATNRPLIWSVPDTVNSVEGRYTDFMSGLCFAAESEFSVKEHPLAMSIDSALAVMRGEKTESRFPVNMRWDTHRMLVRHLLDDIETKPIAAIRNNRFGFILFNGRSEFFLPSRYGTTGDLLWVKEPFLRAKDGTFVYATDNVPITDRWKQPVLLPREGARLFLEITTVGMQRLQEVDEDGAIRQGFRNLEAFKSDWIKKHGYESWKYNGFAWVVSYRKI